MTGSMAWPCAVDRRERGAALGGAGIHPLPILVRSKLLYRRTPKGVREQRNDGPKRDAELLRFRPRAFS